MLDLESPIAKRLIEDERFTQYARENDEGFLVVGFGRLVDRRVGGCGLSFAEGCGLLENDLRDREKQLDLRLSFWRGFTPGRQLVLLAMAFQLGVPRVLRFTNFVSALEARDWRRASREMRDSLWYRRAPARVERLAKMMEAGA